ncbi:hypothetical protein Lfu02_44930 [Longispora fulva]|uniref:Uncharacterized membrane protein YidH (DUF202 family) n=1 Tax=Longispora fulva TaxID=619741 RepID=A0A8J7KXI0_9ACTN|nr:hypothetical protein [Longispora fulva]MBG6137867.1 uncharacterized membrane protein YidH (DUF202 family) [Longispora fulva]GIG60121.1 hypothetical protein Lfu02_44930 [Longispora fulva]
MLRRLLSTAAALGILAEAVAFCGLLFALRSSTREYSISMGGRPTSETVFVLGAALCLLGAFLLAIAAFLLVSTFRPALARPGRVLLIASMPLHWLLMVVGGLLISWWWFGALFVVFVLSLGVLVTQPPRVPRSRRPVGVAEERVA